MEYDTRYFVTLEDNNNNLIFYTRTYDDIDDAWDIYDSLYLQDHSYALSLVVEYYDVYTGEKIKWETIKTRHSE